MGKICILTRIVIIVEKEDIFLTTVILKKHMSKIRLKESKRYEYFD